MLRAMPPVMTICQWWPCLLVHVSSWSCQWGTPVPLVVLGLSLQHILQACCCPQPLLLLPHWAPVPPAVWFLYWCHPCICIIPGTVHTQTVCSWRQSQLPAQTEISLQTFQILHRYQLIPHRPCKASFTPWSLLRHRLCGLVTGAESCLLFDNQPCPVCTAHVSVNVGIHRNMGNLPAATSHKRMSLPPWQLSTANSSSVKGWSLEIIYPFCAGNLGGFISRRWPQLLWVHELISQTVCRRMHFTAHLPILWLLYSSCPLCHVSWALWTLLRVESSVSYSDWLVMHLFLLTAAHCGWGHVSDRGWEQPKSVGININIWESIMTAR